MILWWELRDAPRRTGLLAAGALLLFATVTVCPWFSRNFYWAQRLQQPFYLFQPLGSRAPYTLMYTPGFLAWMRSYEEPFMWSAWDQAPQGPYIDADERREVAALFLELRARNGEVTPEMDRRFRQVSDERYRKAPLRCYVWRPVSAALKYWGSPRLSTVALTITGSPGATTAPKWMRLLFFFLSWTTTAFFALGMALRRNASIGYPLVVTGVTTVILVQIGLNEARYMMPIFGIICAGAGRGIALVAERLNAAKPTTKD